MAGQRMWRALGRGVAAAVLWGVAAALVTRLLMRAVTLVTGGEPHFSVAGTVGIAVAYVVVLLPGALALSLSRGRWPWALLGAGTALLLAMAANIGLQDLGAARGLSTGRTALLVLVVAAMVAVYAAQAALVARTARRAPRSAATTPAPFDPPRPRRPGGLRGDGGPVAEVRRSR